MLDKETPQLITLVPCETQGTKHPFEADASCEKIKHSLLIYFGGRASDERSLTLAVSPG